MLDQGFLPRTTATQTQIFYALGGIGQVEWQPWVKPRNIGMVSIRCIGGAGGGGGGMTGAAGTARGGGGGGGSGAITDVMIPAQFLPDVLYVCVGRGGNGAAATGVGSSGDRSFVGMLPQSAATTPMVICYSGSAGAVGGAAGTAATGGAGGTASTVAGITGAYGHNLGMVTLRAGQTGSAGGAQTGAIGGTIAHAASGLPITSGTGGGGTPIANTDFAGGTISGVVGTLFPQDLLGGVAAAGAGQQGFFMSGNPMWTAIGGTGGGTAGAAGTAGKGGDGSYGSGGGGGGGGVTGGAGGRGGDGLVLICCF